MNISTQDRREFLATSVHALGGAWLAMLMPEIEAAGRAAGLALESGAQLATFTAAEARTFEAAAATIFPEGRHAGRGDGRRAALCGSRARHVFLICA